MSRGERAVAKEVAGERREVSNKSRQRSASDETVQTVKLFKNPKDISSQ